jgi:hypothetical protein
MNGISSTNEEMIRAQKNSVGKSLKGRDLVGDLGLGLGVGSQWNSAELGEDVEYLCLLQDGARWLIIVNAVINIQFP